MSWRRLDAEKIIATADALSARIGERFPESGLARVARDFTRLAHDTSQDALRLEEPILWLRIVIAAAFAGGAAIFAFVGTFLSINVTAERGLGLVEGIEATINMLVLAAVGLFTLVKLEERFKNRAALNGLHSLRSVIHIIDMHQLTKDPVVFSKEFRPTASSPKRIMSATDMKRYLDYCSELLSLSGKLAALYAQSLNNAVVVEAVNDIENLATNLSRKVWQKITLLDGSVRQRRDG